VHADLEFGISDRQQPADAQVAAVVVVRGDDTCTVAWGQAWGPFDKLPGILPNRQEAMRSVARVVGRTVVWVQSEANLWEGRI
jgi:hypothetical protein